jgi:ankyrin repeat protein
VVELEALVEAAKTGDEPKVRALIAAHPQLVVQRLPSGESPLMAALYRGHHPIVATLAELGAEIDVFAAAATGNIGALRQALEQPGARDAYAYDGWTPLHLAAFFGQQAAARLLVDAGASVEAVSRNSLANTPLHAATAGRHTAIALMLVERGADPETADAGGFSARKIAAENRLADVVAAMDRR